MSKPTIASALGRVMAKGSLGVARLASMAINLIPQQLAAHQQGLAR